MTPVRRIVVGEDTGGLSCVVQESADLPAREVGEGVVSTHLWATGCSPAFLQSRDDGLGLVAGAPPPPRGSRVGMLDIAPGAQAGPMHRTDTVDYTVCLVGCVDLQLDHAIVSLSAGEMIVLCGASHTWINRGEEPARLMFVMLDAGPKRPGSLQRSDVIRG